jgi:hypothetical protein
VTPQALKRLDRELTTFVDMLTADFGRPERRAAMAQYITGLLLDGERKSIEPIAARLVDRPDQIEAMRQRLQQCVVVSPWDAEKVFARVARMLDRDSPEVTALVVDDTGFPKKGRHSVGVGRHSTRARSAAQTIVRLRRACISPASAGVAALECGSICPRAGRPIARGVARRMYPIRCRLHRSGSMRSTCSTRR